MNDVWLQARREMHLDPEVANLNTGSFGPWSRPVFKRVAELRTRLAEEPMDFFLRLMPGLLRESREQFGRFLGAEPRRLIFTSNVTAAVNIVAAGLTLAAPGEILLTDHEYLAMQWCWERAAQRQGLTLRTFPLPGACGDAQRDCGRLSVGSRSGPGCCSSATYCRPREWCCRPARSVRKLAGAASSPWWTALTPRP